MYHSLNAYIYIYIYLFTLLYTCLSLHSGDTNLVIMNKPVSVTYSGGKWSGTLAKDLVSIGSSPPVEVEFALITSASNFFIAGAQWSGILGLAYESLAKVSLLSRVGACCNASVGGTSSV